MLELRFKVNWHLKLRKILIKISILLFNSKIIVIRFIILINSIGKMAYNFNPRERQRRTIKFDEYERLGMIRWSMVPIGQFDVNRKYLTSCAQSYRNYNDCLRKTLFDKEECKPKLEEVIACEKDNDLYQTEKKLAILRSFKKKKGKK
jgi:hypothetical protein